jgi:hypothetical protein
MFEGYKGPQFMPAMDSGYMDAYAKGDTEAEREIIHQTARDAGYNIFGYKAMIGDKPHMMGNVPEQEMTFMAQERRVAGMFTEGGQKPIREVATNASNLFDAANPEHFAKFEEWFRDFGLDRYNQEYFEVIEGGKEGPHGRFTWDDLDSLLSFAKDKNYAILEMPSITRWMQESGYDGFYVREDGQGSSTPDNIAVFDPTKIKSIEPETTTLSGQVIPPSQRFDTTKANVNFMPAAKRGEDMETAYRNVTKRTPEVVDAVKKYQKGEIDQKDLFKVIRKYMPYRQMDEVPKPATREEMEMALNEDKVADIGKANENLKDGDLVGLRLDIPAYKDYGVWVASVHDAQEQKLGRIKGYESVAIANDVEFVTNPSVSMDIATGEKNKTSYARMVGKWEATTPEAARKEAEAAMSDPTYIQVGMNPFKNSWFYDRKTGNPVVNADRVIQIGGLVMAKNPVFTSPQDPRFMTKYGVQFMPAKTKKFISQVDETPDVQHDGKGTPVLPKKVPTRGHYNIQMQEDKNGVAPIYKLDPKTTNQPLVKDPLQEHSGERVGLNQTDPQDAIGPRMGGIDYTHLKSNDVIVVGDSGKEYKPVWSSLGLGMITSFLNKSLATTRGMFLIRMMSEDAHKSNKDFMNRLSQDIDALKAKGSFTKNQKMGLHAIFEIGALNPKATLTKAAKKIEKTKKKISEEKDLKKKAEMKADLDAFKLKVEEWKQEWPPLIKFMDEYMALRKTIGQKKGVDFDKNFDDLIARISTEPWFQDIVQKYGGMSFSDEASQFSFSERGNAVEALHKLPYIPSVLQRLDNEADFRGAKNTDLLAAIQVSQTPDEFKVFTGQKRKIPKDASAQLKKIIELHNEYVDDSISKMSASEKKMRGQLFANPKFRAHPSYDWLVLGPANGNNYVFNKPLDPLDLFPNYGKDYMRIKKKKKAPKSREALVNTMDWAAADVPLIMPGKLKK